MEFDLENPLADSDHFSPSLFLLESDHMPSHNYTRSLNAGDLHIVSVRKEAIASISHFSGEFGPFLLYLAVNYLDRFLSSRQILMLLLQQHKTWIVRLVACSCVSLAAKMMKTEFSLTHFQGNAGFVFDAQTIERMEYLILGALKWRMRSVTPFSFVSFFIPLFELKDPPLTQALEARAVEIISKSQIDTKLFEFKASIIAASALLFSSHELFPLQFPCFRKAICSCSYINKENLLKCYNSMQEMEEEDDRSMFDVVPSSSSLVDVLEQQFSSSESEITTTNGVDITGRTERHIKRRRN
ncbi:Cyclin D6;1 [Hibiscus trionum]|uniref:Cyclin D61 n=1 Tax=Hibiscus trionum TaxID=183268 RepID=A0A9W7IP73_HIBTR|nr:Cyclin D6;1 [Hibiscus trionum]